MEQWPSSRYDKVSQGSLWFVPGQGTSHSKFFFLSGVLRRIQYRHRWGLYSKTWHLAATILHGNKIFTFLNFSISISKLNCLFVPFNLSTWDLAVTGIHLCPTFGWALPLLLEQDMSSSLPELMLQKTRWQQISIQICLALSLLSLEPLLPVILLYRMPVLPWRPFCSTSWWQPSVGCSSRESTSTCLLSRSTTSWTKWGYIKWFPGVRKIAKHCHFYHK